MSPVFRLVAVLAAVLVSQALLASAARPTSPLAAFYAAGKTPLEIWRVENFAPVPVPTSDYGTFYSGDSYIVLKTTEGPATGELKQDVYLWLGRETTEDKAGSAAILTRQMFNFLGTSPVHREAQDHESEEFKNLFKDAGISISYLDGGVDGGFKPVGSDKKLYQVKGTKNARVRQVNAHVSSMNKGDCFVLDSGKGNVQVYVGSEASALQRGRAGLVADEIRTRGRVGGGKVSYVDDTSSDAEVADFFKALGGGSPSEVPNAPAGGADADSELELDNTVALYQVSDASGSLKVDTIDRRPLSYKDFDTNDAFVLDTGSSGVYVWIGSNASKEEKAGALKKGKQLLEENEHHSWTKLERVVEGSEPFGFKEYFKEGKLWKY